MFTFIKKLKHYRNSSEHKDISNFMHHGYSKLEFKSRFLAHLKKRIEKNLNRISNHKRKKSFINGDIDYAKRLSLLNCLILKILVKKIRRMERVRSIVEAKELISVEISSTLDLKNYFSKFFLRINQNSADKELYLIMPLSHDNVEISSPCFNFISRQFCNDDCILVDANLKNQCKLKAIDYPDLDFITSTGVKNFVPSDYRLNISSDYQGVVIFNPQKTYYRLFNSSSETYEIYYLKLKFRIQNFERSGPRVLRDANYIGQAQIYLGGINSS